MANHSVSDVLNEIRQKIRMAETHSERRMYQRELQVARDTLRQDARRSLKDDD